jgi:hypothetical protein
VPEAGAAAAAAGGAGAVDTEGAAAADGAGGAGAAMGAGVGLITPAALGSEVTPVRLGTAAGAAAGDTFLGGAGFLIADGAGADPLTGGDGAGRTAFGTATASGRTPATLLNVAVLTGGFGRGSGLAGVAAAVAVAVGIGRTFGVVALGTFGEGSGLARFSGCGFALPAAAAAFTGAEVSEAVLVIGTRVVRSTAAGAAGGTCGSPAVAGASAALPAALGGGGGQVRRSSTIGSSSVISCDALASAAGALGGVSCGGVAPDSLPRNSSGSMKFSPVCSGSRPVAEDFGVAGA